MSVLSDTIEWLGDSAHWSGDDGVPHRLVQHLGYTSLTVAIAAAIAIPIGLWIGHTGRLRGLAVVSSGALRALPTLGVLTYASLFTGIGIKAAIFTLVLLAIPPLLAGAYSGLESVDRRTVDAARAMGMTELQILTRVEVPLALPIIIGGLRSATLQVVATATVAAYIPGPGGLGRYLIDGLALNDYPQVVAGSIVVIVLALVLDGIFVLLQRLVLRNRPATVRIAA
ncbi:ABC transporter permease [Aeromicrobium chenweiae]|uniref:Glycine/betaine ABC transporter permease n=1 Tax=Aeromicrobium chenweiae TaxID=2079793 RepID=A0A2S0WIF2_9ACTN|nr:ABC transporter permease [Aeromicrobium chenweiae]AWB91087.1 glycine/betaine ABC transporter permease [Aeromicrobium chenweiae]TGN31990.1 ABC transporter permease [Aeromicrobium chenweiae]